MVRECVEHGRKGLQAVTRDALEDVLKRAQLVLFDFDGPMCSVFAGLPAHDVAATLATYLKEEGFELTDSELAEPDPLEVLRYSVRFGPEIVRSIEDMLCAAELEAVRVAEPTPGSDESVQACLDSGRQLAILSNNSAAAVTEYLRLHGLTDSFGAVVGRAYAAPHLMKPHPAPLIRVLDLAGFTAEEAVLIGDSVTDVEVSKVAAVPCIAYANKPEKWRTLDQADVMVGHMSEIAAAVAAR